MLYKGPPIKFGVSINGTDIADLDQTQVTQFIASLPNDQQEIITGILKSKNGFYDVPDDYAKNYGRPSLKVVPYMQSENDGMPYLAGHSPNCDGKIKYSYDIYSPKTLCFCKWARRHTRNS